MGIALVIVGGLALMTLIAVVGDVAGKSAKAKHSVGSKEFRDLARRVEALEKEALEGQARVRELESGIAFLNRLLEDKTGKD